MCSLRTTKFLGEGQSSKVYAAVNSNKRSMAVKVTVRDTRFNVQPCEIEYTVMSRLHDIVPSSVPATYGGSWCRNFKPGAFKRNAYKPDTSQQYVMKMEFFPRGDLHKMLEQFHKQRKLTNEMLRVVIAQVLSSLRQIQKRIPSFRHNDLHLHNILIGDMPRGNVSYYNGYGIPSLGFRCIIYDFNLSTMAGVNNPLISDPRLKSDYGIYPGNSDKYDLHFFLNSMLDWVTKNGRGGAYNDTKDFLIRSLPMGYHGRSDAKVQNFRLKPNVSTNSMASLELIMKDPFFASMKALFNAPEEGEILNLPVNKPPNRPANARPGFTRPELKMMNVGAPRKRVEEVYLPPALRNSAKYRALVNLMTEPEPNGFESAENRRNRENQGRANAARELLNAVKKAQPPKRAVPVINRPVLVLPPPLVVTRPVQPKAVTFEQKYGYAFKSPGHVRPETKVLAPKNAPPMTEVKAPKFVAPKPMSTSSLYKSMENLLKQPNREKFMYKMNMHMFKSGSLPRIQLEGAKSLVKCESLDRELLELIAMEHGLNPKLYKNKGALCMALKGLHNA